MEDNDDDIGKPGKPSNTYNGRKSTRNKKGGQAGHRGTTLTRKTVEEKIQEGKFTHQVRTIGQGSGNIRNSDVVCTDATTMFLDGKQAYVRNMSTGSCVVYMPMLSKTIETMKEWPLLAEFAGILEHDHETGIYHF